MSGEIRVRFEEDMPVSAVEVLAPDMQTVKRIALRPGTEQRFHVPSERSIVRVHLPSGRIVTLPRDESLDYVISRADLEPKGERREPSWMREKNRPGSVHSARKYRQARSASVEQRRATGTAPLFDELYGIGQRKGATKFGPGIDVVWEPNVEGVGSSDGSELSYSPSKTGSPYRMRLTAGETKLSVILPGSLQSAYLRCDDVGESLLVTVRVSCRSQLANTVGGYLARGDYYAAETLAPFAESAQGTLIEKHGDPFAAAVAAYLLLRLERYDLMHEWARNLADFFRDISDGCVIWASQALRQKRDIEEASKYYLLAAERGWPVFTEGTRILTDKLHRVKGGREVLQRLAEKTGAILWTSPFTAHLQGPSIWEGRRLSFDIGYEPSA